MRRPGESIAAPRYPFVHASQNPTLQGLYPRQSTLTILRTVNGSLTPLPGITAFGSDGSVFAQLFYDGVEQFYCSADSCTQQVDAGGSDWNCQNLHCQCIPGTSFCGGVPLTDLTGVLNQLSGTLEISCDAASPENNTANCAFKQQVINQVFGSSGLALDGCAFGECVAQNVIDVTSTNGTSQTDSSAHGSSLSGGVIAGLAVVGGLVALALGVIFFGWILQRRARRNSRGGWGDRFGGVTTEWTGISYFVPSQHSTFAPLRRRRRTDQFNDLKVVLDNVSGRVEPGQMMAILGPSGKYRCSSGILRSLTLYRCGKDDASRDSGGEEQERPRFGCRLVPCHRCGP